MVTPWLTPHFNSFPESQSNPTVSVPGFLIIKQNSCWVSISQSSLLLNDMLFLTLTHAFWILAQTGVYSKDQHFCVITWESQLPLWKTEVLALKDVIIKQDLHLKEANSTPSTNIVIFKSLPTLGSAVILKCVGKAEDCLNCIFFWKSLLYRYTSLPPIPVISIAFGGQGEGRSYLKVFSTGDQKMWILSYRK